MSTVRVTVEGVPSFTWEGSAVDVERLLEKVHAASQSGDVTAAQLTDFCVLELWKNQGKVSADMKGSQMTGVLWRILTSSTGHPEHPGKLADYVGFTDFEVDIQSPDGRKFRFIMTATSKHDA